MIVIGAIISAITGLVGKGFDFLNKRADVDLEKYKVDGEFDTTRIKALEAVSVARAADTTDRWGRRLFIYPTGVYYAFTMYDSTFRNYLPGDWTARTLELPDDFKWIVMSVVGYLLVNTLRRAR